MAWPPTLPELKVAMNRDLDDTRDDERLQEDLDAAVAFVERVRSGDFNFTADPLSTLPDPTPDLVLGTKRLAARWHARLRSQDGTVDMGELGLTRVAGSDPDINRLLRIGRHQKARVG